MQKHNMSTAATSTVVHLTDPLMLMCMQGHHAEFLVFWIGLAFWLLFALIPSRNAMALVLRKVDQVLLKPGVFAVTW